MWGKMWYIYLMTKENFDFSENSELSPERKLEIALAYIKDDMERRGKEAPHFNSVEMKERVRNTIKGKHLSGVGVTEQEAMEFLREILS